MMDRRAAQQLMDRLHAALGAYYAGGESTPLRELFTDDVRWHVPGRSAIAGHHEGFDDVLAYFTRRRALAHDTFRMHPTELLFGDEHLAVHTDGEATIAGAQHRWSTLGLYRLRDGRIAECWLFPFDQELFDAAWRSP